MIHHAVPSFWEAYNALPLLVRKNADKALTQLKANPSFHTVQERGDVLVSPGGSPLQSVGRRRIGWSVVVLVRVHDEYERLIY